MQELYLSDDEIKALMPFCSDKHPEQAELLEALVGNGYVVRTARRLGRNTKAAKNTIKRLRNRRGENGQRLNKAIADMVPQATTKSRTITRTEPDGTKVREVIRYSSKQDKVLSLENAILAAASVKPRKPVKPIKSDDNSFCALAVLTDLHINMLADAAETGHANWNVSIAKECAMEAFDDHVYNFLPKLEWGILVDGGDMGHMDSVKAVTPGSGNVLSASTWTEMIDASVEIMVYGIESMRKRCKNVVAITVRGNHNETTAYLVNKVLQAMYANDPHVHIPDNANRLNSYIWEKNQIVTHHGDKRAINKQILHNAVTSQFRNELSGVNTTIGISGHIHHKTKFDDVPGYDYRTFPTLCPPDGWHAESLYGADRAMTCALLRQQGGIKQTNDFDPIKDSKAAKALREAA